MASAVQHPPQQLWIKHLQECDRGRRGRWCIYKSAQSFDDNKMREWCDELRSDFRGYHGPSVVLREVDFSSNRLTSVGVKTLLSTLQKLPVTVEILKLHKNQVQDSKDVCAFITESNGRLEQLHITDNKLTTDAMFRIIDAVVSSGYYPQQDMPFWLQSCRNEYDAEALETRMRNKWDLSKILCVVDRSNWKTGDLACRPYKCTVKSKTPVFHATFLFQRRSDIPAVVHKALKKADANWPGVVKEDGEYKIDMRAKGLTDADVESWCDAFRREHVASGRGAVLFKEIDFSENKLSRSGIVRLLRFLGRQGVKVGFIKKNGNAFDAGDDVDLAMFDLSRRPRAAVRCPTRAFGCLCGAQCTCVVQQSELEAHWEECVIPSCRKDGTEVQKIDMQDAGIDDEAMALWCQWFTRYVQERQQTAPIFQVIDFSVNSITATGMALLLETLDALDIQMACLRLHENQIALDSCSSITSFIERKQLHALHIGGNQMGTSVVLGIIVAIASMQRDGQYVYPIDGTTPFWLRAEKNKYDSRALEDQLRQELHSKGRPFDEAICVTSHSFDCSPWRCTRRSNPPAIHVMYLFPHMERHTSWADAIAASVIAERKGLTAKCTQRDLELALQALAPEGLVAANSPVVTPKTLMPLMPLAGGPKRQPRAKPKMAPVNCWGYPRLDQRQSAWGTPPMLGSLDEEPQGFLPQTLFHHVGENRYVMACELRDEGGDQLEGPGGSTVNVFCCIRGERRTRRVATIRAEHASQAILVTPGQRLQTLGHAGCGAEPTEAQLIVERFQRGESVLLYDGSSFQAVIDASMQEEDVEVVAVYFEGNLAALALGVQDRRPPNELDELGCFSVLGSGFIA